MLREQAVVVAAAPIWLLIRGYTASFRAACIHLKSRVRIDIYCVYVVGQAAGSSLLEQLLLQHCATCGIISQYWLFDKLISICEAPTAHPSLLSTLCSAVLCEGAGLVVRMPIPVLTIAMP